MAEWQPIKTAPKDGTTIRARGVGPVAGKLFYYGEEVGETRWLPCYGWHGGPAYPTHWKPITEPTDG